MNGSDGFDFIPGLRTFDNGEHGIDGDFARTPRKAVWKQFRSDAGLRQQSRVMQCRAPSSVSPTNPFLCSLEHMGRDSRN